jgi:hypothetical protein
MSPPKVPAPCYSVFDTSRGSELAVVVVNSALRLFDERSAFSWHLELTIECRMLAANGMPTIEEVGALARLEDLISEPLTVGDNAVLLSSVTCRGQRELAYRVHDPELANDILSRLINTGKALREWDYRMEQDAAWEFAQPVFGLLNAIRA